MPTLAEYRDQARSWLASVAQPHDVGHWGAGSDDVSLFPEWDLAEEAAQIAAAREWLELRHAAGFGGIAFPEEFGGRGLTAAHDLAYQIEEGHFSIPSREIWNIGFGMVLPTIMSAGDEAQRERFVPPGLRGELLFCQLFSEPGAGSDLGALTTRSVRTDAGWSITGRKIWTSMARGADYGLLLTRSGGAEAPRSDAFTMFLVPMRSTGVEIAPIRQATGGASFNEVTFDGVLVGDDLRLGRAGGGWQVAMQTLGHERVALPVAGPAGSMDRLVAMARHFGSADDPAVRDALATLYTMRRILDLNAERTLAALTAGEAPGPEGSVAKLIATEFLTRISDFVADVLGERMAADTGEWGTWSWTSHWLGSIGLHIGGGTDEIHKNMLAERALGMPRSRPAVRS